MTKGRGIREYRACVRCRSRKIKCDMYVPERAKKQDTISSPTLTLLGDYRQNFGDPGKPPCVKCHREGATCILAGSGRGGNFSHLRRSKKQASFRQNNLSRDGIAPQSLPHSVDIQSHVHDSLQNPSDALLILAHVAGQPDKGNSSELSTRTETPSPFDTDTRPPITNFPITNQEPAREFDGAGEDIHKLHPLLQNGTITLDLLFELLILQVSRPIYSPTSFTYDRCRYQDNYHPFFPIVPASVLDPKNITNSLKHESFLITAILVISSKDLPNLSQTNKSIWSHLQQRILQISLGASGTRHINCVEGLLLLGEWSLPNQSEYESNGEAPWSIIGLAVRLAYRLRLEDSSFNWGRNTNRDKDSDTETQSDRKRLVWTFTYLSDRQISIRMGQAFWCRGPALSARFTAQDFPTLQSKSTVTSKDDLASWLQAQVEITTLFGNAHDILFASKSRTTELITRGDYVKYIDDTSRALAAWESNWRDISVSKPLRSCLALMREYLRLYVNAFAFQAVLYRGRSASARLDTDADPNVDLGLQLDFPYSTMASADARHVYDALDAAESLLRIFTEEFDTRQLRCLPDRFYLYEIHSSVFIFKSNFSGAISSDRYEETKKLMRRFLTVLDAVPVNKNHKHVASHYAKLLRGLWFRRKEDCKGGPARRHSDQQDDHTGSGDTCSNVSANLARGPPCMNVDMNGGGSVEGSILDDSTLELFDGIDGLDGLLAMAPVFPYDLSLFLDGIDL
ncbi:hypothetical protein N7456_004047 [Penicillium angulare]|uniref:Xylanolytic transcriptional activator regulatory domain-containing protein n=1 Tax=Penicillium angulare TaxID=116970 RepID=A0A9W9KJB2_9EURO|nr:hypothetical protein N7456_004047 [Penicillium angulare]